MLKKKSSQKKLAAGLSLVSVIPNYLGTEKHTEESYPVA